MKRLRWIKTAAASALTLLACHSALAENFYLSAGVGRVRASGMSDATLSLHLVAGMPVDYNMSLEVEHIEVQDVGSWFDASTDTQQRLFSSHTGVAGVWFLRPNPGVRLQARLGLGTTKQEGAVSGVGTRRIWEMEPGIGASVVLSPNLRLGLEANHFWRSKVNILALTGYWSF